MKIFILILAGLLLMGCDVAKEARQIAASYAERYCDLDPDARALARREFNEHTTRWAIGIDCQPKGF